MTVGKKLDVEVAYKIDGKENLHYLTTETQLSKKAFFINYQ